MAELNTWAEVFRYYNGADIPAEEVEQGLSEIVGDLLPTQTVGSYTLHTCGSCDLPSTINSHAEGLERTPNGIKGLERKLPHLEIIGREIGCPNNQKYLDETVRVFERQSPGLGLAMLACLKGCVDNGCAPIISQKVHDGSVQVTGLTKVVN